MTYYPGEKTTEAPSQRRECHCELCIPMERAALNDTEDVGDRYLLSDSATPVVNGNVQNTILIFHLISFCRSSAVG